MESVKSADVVSGAAAGGGGRAGPFNNLVPLRSAQSERKCVLAASLIWQNEKTAEAHSRIFTLCESLSHIFTF